MTVLPMGGGGGTSGVGGEGGMAGGGAGGMGGMGGEGGMGGAPDDSFVSPCADADNDVAMLGDSYVNWITHDFPGDMRAKAGKQWSLYAVGATSMATGGVGRIPDQLPMALADNPELKAIVMTGGGNDILVADTVMFPEATQCTSVPTSPMIEDCQKIVQTAVDRAIELMDETADAGVKDVVYFFYPHIPGGGLISGPSPNEILDYALPKAKEACDSALERTEGRMRCTFVDMVPEFEGKAGLFADDFSEAGDGVHPNFEGSKVMADAIWRVMQDKCIGQPSSSGCCMASP
jgi:lysophospholipase L1-like esterase